MKSLGASLHLGAVLYETGTTFRVWAPRCRAVEVVIAHYFQPNAAQYHQLLESKMPEVLTGIAERRGLQLDATADARAWVQQKLESMTSETWLIIREEILAGIATHRGGGV